MQFSRPYNASNAEAARDFSPLPKGSYIVQIENVEDKANGSGWEGLSIKLRVIDGQYKNRILFDTVTTVCDSSPQAVDIGNGRMSAYAKALGYQQLTCSEQMLGKTIDIYVGIAKDGRDGSDTNRIYGVSALKTPQQQANMGFQPSQPMQTNQYGNINNPGIYANNQPQVMQPNFPQQQPVATNANVGMQGNQAMYNNNGMPQMSGSILQGSMPRPNSTVGSNQQNEDIPF